MRDFIWEGTVLTIQKFVEDICGRSAGVARDFAGDSHGDVWTGGTKWSGEIDADEDIGDAAGAG